MRNDLSVLPTDYQTFIHLSRYARWLPEKGRREHWDETVHRYVDKVLKPVIGWDAMTLHKIEHEIMALGIMPSMRGMMTAGPALYRDNTCIFNCAYTVIDCPVALDEALFILMCGTGIGYSVERRYVDQLPVVPDTFVRTRDKVVVEDSKEGWGYAFRKLLDYLWRGYIPGWNTDKVRPAGSVLNTFGGRASGPEPLIRLFQFAVKLFKEASGRKLRPIEVHDLMCMIAEIVVVGGVRRSAMICLFDADDEEMLHAKTGDWWMKNPQRAMANNSAVYNDKPSLDVFNKAWDALRDGMSGEPGFFNRMAAKMGAEEIGRDARYNFGTNPCAEIVLRPQQFCNLSEVVVRPDDPDWKLIEKVKLATIVGTVQSTYTHFPYLRDIWRKNTEEERLLGVSLTGIQDHPKLRGLGAESKLLRRYLRDIARQTNIEWANNLGIPHSAAITCVKPSGTVSQLVDSASGIHARHSHYYIRSVRNDMKDPITQLMVAEGVPHEPAIGKERDTMVFYFPMKSPDKAIVRTEQTGVSQLETWRHFKKDWCDHNPSCTISVRDHEWDFVGDWVWQNFDDVMGLSFLPMDEHVYAQAPYQDCTKEEYEAALKAFPKNINWDRLALFENGDMTVSSQQLACVAGYCEI